MYDGVIVGVGEEGLDVSSECGEGVEWEFVWSGCECSRGYWCGVGASVYEA